MALVLATPAQLRTQVQDSTLDETVAQQAIDYGVALVKAVSGQDLEFVAGDTVVLAGGARELVLPQRPIVVDDTHPLTVVELPDVGVAGVTVTDGLHFRRVGNRLIKQWRSRSMPMVRTRGHLEYAAVPSGIWSPWVRVTYSHGYAITADVPAEWTAMVLDAAATRATNPTGLRSVALDSEVTLTYSGESISAPRTLVDDLRTRLRGLGMRRGGAFSIAST